MCMEDIRIGRAEKYAFGQLTGTAAPQQIPGSSKRTRLILTEENGGNIFILKDKQMVVGNALRIPALSPLAGVMRIEDWGLLVTDGFWVISDGAAGVINYVEVYMDTDKP